MELFLCLMAVIALSSAAPAEDPSQCIGQCPKVDILHLLPHKNYSKFCSCVHGKPVVLNCPEGLFYSPKDQICDYKHNIKFPENVISQQSSVQAPKPVFYDGACLGYCPSNHPAGWTILLQHKDCDKYCKCMKGNAYTRECPLGLHFSTILGVCTYEEEANCKPASSATTTTTTSTTITSSTENNNGGN